MKNRLKVKRWEAGMKQYELAIKLKCSAPYLSMVENGRIYPPKKFWEKAAAILNLDVAALVPDNGANYEELTKQTFRT